MTAKNPRTKPINVGPDKTNGLLAAWDGIYHLFGGRVESWDITPEGIVAQGFSVDSQYNPDTILTDINRRDRRPLLFPTILWIQGIEPALFESNQSITTFMVQYFKGSVEEGTSRSPLYVRQAAGAYKERTGTKVKRGPKPKTLQFKNLNEVSAETLIAAGISKESLAHLLEVAQTAMDATPDTVKPTEAPVEAAAS
jgi:hypothetical protein